MAYVNTGTQGRIVTSRLPLVIGMSVALFILMLAGVVASLKMLSATDDSGEAIVSLDAHSDTFVCRSEGKNIVCSGQSDYGALGVADKNTHFHSFDLDGDVAFLDAGENFACASTGVGVTCWGDNRWRQAGDSDEKIVAPSSLKEFESKKITSLSLGAYHACAIVEAEVMCWGAGNSGQLGTGAPGDSANSPQRVPLPRGQEPLRLYASDFSTFVETTTHEWYAFGANNDARIDNEGSQQLAPVKIGETKSTQ